MHIVMVYMVTRSGVRASSDEALSEFPRSPSYTQTGGRGRKWLPSGKHQDRPAEWGKAQYCMHLEDYVTIYG